MLQIIVDYALIVAFVALTADIIMQIFHIAKRKSSGDISIKGCIIRSFGALVLLIKFFLLSDIYLVIGQTIFLLSYATYFLLIIYYRK